MNPTQSCRMSFLKRPAPDTKSKVAITCGKEYAEAERMVNEALDLLGIESVCKRGDNVLVKPNLCLPTPPEDAETTHPAVVAAVVKRAKQEGGTVWVGESCAWHFPMELVFETTQVRQAALDAGADEVVDLGTCEFVDAQVPNPRVMKTAAIPKPVVDADVIINLPKMKNNFVTLTTLSIKNMLGLLRPEDRHPYHRTPMDMAWACNDIFKIINRQHRLTLIDGIWGVEGATHAGPVCKPGVIVASEDPIAAEAIGNMIMGYHALESAQVQIGMKDDLGTGEPAEIEVVGARVEDVRHPFERCLMYYVSRYPNVSEYYGGTCQACVWPAVALPSVVNPDKKYAVVAGARVFIADKLEDVDEVYLVGTCACAASHQFEGYMDKVNAARKVIKMPTCPGLTHTIEERMGGVYDMARDGGFPELVMADGLAFVHLPDRVRPELVPEAVERREGRKTTWP